MTGKAAVDVIGNPLGKPFVIIVTGIMIRIY
jgi:hypothetical protein